MAATFGQFPAIFRFSRALLVSSIYWVFAIPLCLAPTNDASVTLLLLLLSKFCRYYCLPSVATTVYILSLLLSTFCRS